MEADGIDVVISSRDNFVVEVVGAIHNNNKEILIREISVQSVSMCQLNYFK